MKILVTGGAGCIGSHTCVELLNDNYEVVVIDNLDNSNSAALNRVQQITGKSLIFYEADVRDKTTLHTIFNNEQPNAVIHFAGLKAVGESVSLPHTYYQNNIDSTLVLTEVMKIHGCQNLIFSSSATVYGDPALIPITEEWESFCLLQ